MFSYVRRGSTQKTPPIGGVKIGFVTVSVAQGDGERFAKVTANFKLYVESSTSLLLPISSSINKNRPDWGGFCLWSC